MILGVLILIPLVGGLLAWAAGPRHSALPRWIALAAMLVDLALAVRLWVSSGQPLLSGPGPWLRRLDLGGCPSSASGSRWAWMG